MAAYTRKPLLVDAWQYPGGDPDPTAAYPDWLAAALLTPRLEVGSVWWASADTLHVNVGMNMRFVVAKDDWITREPDGTITPVKADAFAANYDPV